MMYACYQDKATAMHCHVCVVTRHIYVCDTSSKAVARICEWHSQSFAFLDVTVVFSVSGHCNGSEAWSFALATSMISATVLLGCCNEVERVEM